ncbi:MAG: hypothetical protein COB23_01745 [Methylophaga sp.]|nr:MAG: hypothetical protein COB23_01745 [Methylophaga sp.]
MKLRVVIVLILSLMWGAYSWEWYTCRIKGLCNLETIMAEIIPTGTENLATIRDNITNAIEDALADDTDNNDTSDNDVIVENTTPSIDSNNESAIDTLNKDILSDSLTNEDQDKLPNKIEEVIETDLSNIKINKVHQLSQQQSFDADNNNIISTLDAPIEPETIQPTQTTDIETERQIAELATQLIDQPEIEIDTQAIGTPEIEVVVSEPKAIDQPMAIEVEELQIEHGQIHFPYRSHLRPLLSTELEIYLSNLVIILISGKHVHLIGHTDNVGNDEKNHTLGLKRAQMIQRLLIKRGATKNSITIESKGKLNPIGDNNTEVGRQMNRRVEIIITP